MPNCTRSQKLTRAELEQFVLSVLPKTPDSELENHSSIFLLCPLTETARTWLEGNIGSDNGFQPHWPTVVVDHRYIQDIVRGIQDDGLTVRA